MLTSSAPPNISGNKVSTSIFMPHLSLLSVAAVYDRRRNEYSARRFFFHNFQQTAQTLLGAARRQQRTDGINRHPLPPNYSAHIPRVETQFIHCQPIALDRPDRHLVRVFDQALDHIFQEGLHTPLMPPPSSSLS